MRSNFYYSGIIWFVLICINLSAEASIEELKTSPVNLIFNCVEKANADSKKPPIVLMHGSLVTKENWKGTIGALAFLTSRKVCAVDLRNHGESPWNDDTSIAAMTADIVHLLDNLQTQTAVLIGHSLGGKVAIHTAVNYPKRVDSLVVEDITPELSPSTIKTVTESFKVLNQVMNLVPEGSDEETARKFIIDRLNEILKFQRNVTLEDFGVNFVCSPEKCHWKANLEAILNAITKDFASFWTPTTGTFSGPALFLYGTNSHFRVFDFEDEIRKMFPQVKMVAVEGADHVIHSAFPQFEDEVVKFLQRS